MANPRREQDVQDLLDAHKRTSAQFTRDALYGFNHEFGAKTLKLLRKIGVAEYTKHKEDEPEILKSTVTRFSSIEGIAKDTAGNAFSIAASAIQRRVHIFQSPLPPPFLELSFEGRSVTDAEISVTSHVFSGESGDSLKATAGLSGIRYANGRVDFTGGGMPGERYALERFSRFFEFANAVVFGDTPVDAARVHEVLRISPTRPMPDM